MWCPSREDEYESKKEEGYERKGENDLKIQVHDPAQLGIEAGWMGLILNSRLTMVDACTSKRESWLDSGPKR